MDIPFNTTTHYQAPYRFENTPETILRFPFPFGVDQYMYSMNIEPHGRGGETPALRHTFDIDEHYVAECTEKARILALDPERCIVLPHMRMAEWDFVELAMESLASDHPAYFSLIRDDARWHWINRPLGIERSFVFGDDDSLDGAPFAFMARQMQGDFTLQDQRDDDLWMDGGMVTAQADWSLKFDVGMSFRQWHAPVPRAGEMGIFDRALRYLLMMQHGQPVRRLNWTMTINPRLDTAPETFHLWGPDRQSVTVANAGDLVHLRVELQALFRLPRSNAILFSVRCYLLPLRDVVRVPKWGARLHRVLRDLDPALSAYKGLDSYRQQAVDYLAPFDDGRALPDGCAPDPDISLAAAGEEALR